MVVAAALNERMVTLNDVFFCENGEFHFGGHRLRDSEGHRYGNMTVQEIMMKSSNIGAGKIGMKLGPDRLYRYIHDFGFGSRTALPLPGEVNPQVRQVKDWYKISIVQIPMGQGINVTRMQMTMAMAAIANKGVLMRPLLVQRLETRQGQVLARFSPPPIRQVISETAARQTTETLKAAATSDGTGYRAALDHYTVAGKTGTAQKAGPGGYGGGRYFASFIGFFPADNPEICISVILDEPDVKKGYYGGTTAAPVFKSVAERTARYLNLKPDIDPPGGPGSLAQAAH
jgi:cell division protein FtsI/penicillin-binding protein 2